MKNKILENLIYIILLCLPTYLIRFTVFNIPLTVLEILILFLFLLFCIKTKLRFSWGSYRYIILSFIIISIIACIASADQMRALGLWKAYIIEPILFFLVFINIKPVFHKVLFSLGLSAIFISLIGIIQYSTGYGIPVPWNIAGSEFRITSVFEYPNAVGLYLAPIMALFLGNLTKIKYKTYFSLIVLLLSLSAILWSQTQGAWLAVIVSFIFLGFFTKYKKIFIASLIIGVIILFAIPGFRETIMFKDTSGDVRLALWQGTANLLTHRPFFGAGLGSFPEIYEQYKMAKHTELLLYAHNIFLDFWTQFGILGLLWLIWVLLKFFINNFKNLSPTTVTIMAAMVAIIIYGLVDVPYFKNDLSVLFWTILGLAEINRK
jgi:O-antigen ligase